MEDTTRRDPAGMLDAMIQGRGYYRLREELGRLRLNLLDAGELDGADILNALLSCPCLSALTPSYFLHCPVHGRAYAAGLGNGAEEAFLREETW